MILEPYCNAFFLLLQEISGTPTAPANLRMICLRYRSSEL